MWHVALAAAVAGSGIIARNLFNTNADPTASTIPQQTHKSDQQHNNELLQIDQQPQGSIDSPKSPLLSTPSASNSPTPLQDDAIFRFSSSGSRNGSGFRSFSKSAPKKSGIGSGRRSKGNADGFKRGIEVQKLEKRFSLCLKRRKTSKNASVNSGSCSSKDNSLFGWGLGVGIMYMMSAGKAEISKLNASMDETAKVVQDLKCELYKRKSSRNLQFSSSASEVTTTPKRNKGMHSQPALTKSSPENRDPNNIKVSGFSVTDDGECASSVLTEEPEPELLEMDQLEAELESELQKLPWCTTEASSNEVIRSDFGETETLAKGFDEPGQSSNSNQFHGVLPTELDKKLSHLLIEQQESQIVELESELHLAHSKLNEKEAELQALKDCVRRLTEFSLSTVSDDETEEHMKQERMSNWDHHNKMGAESNKPVVGMKRAVDSESCGY
ncbi:hypothetical protein L1049_008134 [Liquidambar formosana]|uniref:Uncharacterized protein n=1 Tax=Liquidambar formosana TaxID=63359 RepID=A0AAP0X588_LIQFO